MERAWRVVDPVLGTVTTPLETYAAGQWGPAEADCLTGGHRRLAPAGGAERLLMAVRPAVGVPVRRRQHAARQRRGPGRPRAHLARESGAEAARALLGDLRGAPRELGYADYLGALQRYRLERAARSAAAAHVVVPAGLPVRRPAVSRGARRARAPTARCGTTVILSDGDVVFQPRKVERSGIRRAVGRSGPDLHPQGAGAGRCRAFLPGRALRADRRQASHSHGGEAAWGSRVTTVFARQGHYAHDPELLAAYPPADVSSSASATCC